MRGSVEHESEIMAQILSFKDDPYSFVHYAYPWGRESTPFEKYKGPRRWQLEELEAITEHVQRTRFAIENNLPAPIYRGAYSSGRGPGKSALFGMLSHWQLSTHLGSTCIITANTELQLRSRTFPEFAVWFGSAINAHWFTLETMRIVPAQWFVDIIKKLPEEGGLGIDPKYYYANGQTWSEENPNAFAGVHNPYGLLLGFDEAAGIHSEVWNVAEGFWTETNPYRLWLAASQMRAKKGRFYEIFYDKQMGHGWRTRTMSTRGMEGVDQAVVEDQIKRYGADSDFVRVEIDGLAPRTAEDQFIPQGNITAAQTNALVSDWGEPLILGVDPAPRGKSAWRFRQGRNARDCCGPATRGVWEGKDNVQIAQAVLDLDSKYHPDAICVDFGMGTGVIDILKRKYLRHKLHVVNFSESPHKADNLEWATHAIELWAKMRDWLPGGMIEQDSGDKGTLSFQLMNRGWRWSQKEDGKKILETKKDMKARGVDSPDDADALACTFEVNPPRRDDDRARGKPLMAQGVGSSMTDD
jgi:hypothetical protein